RAPGNGEHCFRSPEAKATGPGRLAPPPVPSSCLSFSVPSRWLQQVAADQGRDAIAVLAMAVACMAPEVAGLLVPVDVHGVLALRGVDADLLDLEPAAEVGGDRGQKVVVGLVAHGQADDAGGRAFRPDAQPDEALRLAPRLALTGRAGCGSV